MCCVMAYRTLREEQPVTHAGSANCDTLVHTVGTYRAAAILYPAGCMFQPSWASSTIHPGWPFHRDRSKSFNDICQHAMGCVMAWQHKLRSMEGKM
jgi:hypothetical protein